MLEMSKTEAALVERVATMTNDQADALAGRSATAYRTAEQKAQSALFPVAVALGRQVHLGTVVDGRTKSAETCESFGAWGTRHGFTKSATVTLLKRLAQAVGHGITPTTDGETWAGLVQVGTRKVVGEALDAKPNAKNSAKVRQVVAAELAGTKKRTSKTADEKAAEKKAADAAKKAAGATDTDGEVLAPASLVTPGNILETMARVRSWFDTAGNLSTVDADVLATLAAHLQDMSEAVEAASVALAEKAEKAATPATVAAIKKTA